ncbi:MAG: STAS domain-containing protein [Acidobacteriaceae bacterium]
MAPHHTAPKMQTDSLYSSMTILTCPPELVRGKEQVLLTAAVHEVERNSVQLDMSQVHTIDAAGLGILLTLHRYAENSGTRFEVISPAPRVLELLALTHLDSVLHVTKDHLTAA